MALGGGATIVLLHVSHVLLTIITIVGLHISGQMYDLQAYIDVNKEIYAWNEEQEKEGKKVSDAVKEREAELNPFYFSGMTWALIVGLLGVLALAVLILSFIFNLPKIIQWCYLVASILIFFFASLGLGYNGGVKEYNKCLEPKDAKVYHCTHYKHYGGVFYRFVIYIISILHAVAYLAAFLVTFYSDGSSSVGGSSNNQAAQQQQQERERQERERIERERQDLERQQMQAQMQSQMQSQMQFQPSTMA